MKVTFHFYGFLLIFVLVSVLSIHTAKASRFLATPEDGRTGVMVNELKQPDHSTDMDTETSWNHLMGMEECEDGDDQCLRRRMISEAHLDYIYTQHQKP